MAEMTASRSKPAGAGRAFGLRDQPAAQPQVLRLARALRADAQRRAVDVHLADHGRAGDLGQRCQTSRGLAEALEGLTCGQRQPQEPRQPALRPVS